MAKSKAIADLVKSLNAILKARAMSGKVDQMTKRESVLDDVFTSAGNRIKNYKPRDVIKEDDFVTTAADMSFAKSGLNASTYNKRRLLQAVENWNRNKKYDYFRGENTRSSSYRPKNLNSPEGKRFLEAEEKILRDMVNAGFNRGITGGRKPVTDKYQRGFRDAFFSNDPKIADAYSRSNRFGIPVIKKIRLNKEQIQRGMERNFESNTAAGQDDIILQRDLLEKATRSFWRGIMRKFQKYNNGGLATVLQI
jgi:Ni/Co efflux regulator RcnB